MDKYEIIEIQDVDGTLSEYVVIDWGNNEFTTIAKSIWDAQQDAETL